MIIIIKINEFAEFVHFILVSDHALLHSYPITDTNTSTGVIWVTLNMGRSAMPRTVIELSGNFTLSGKWSPWIIQRLTSALVHLTLVEVRLSSCCCDIGQMAFGPESLVKIQLVNRGVKKQHLSLISRLCDIVLPNVVKYLFCCHFVTLQTALDAMKYRYDTQV